MNISSVSSSSPLNSDPYQAMPHPFQDLKGLRNAIKSGNFADAQQLLETFQTDLLSRFQIDINATPNDHPQIADDMAALQNAISSNDMDGAHQALVTLRHDLRAMRPGHQSDGGVVEGPMPPTVIGESDPFAQTGTILDTQA